MRNENEMKKNLSEHTKEQLNPEAREHISQPRRDTTHRHIQVKKIFSLSNVCFAMAVILITVSGLVITNTIHKGGESAKAAYEDAKDKAKDDAYQLFYDTAYVSAERKYHVSNNVSIEVASIREKASIEVLKVSDVEYVIESKENNENGIECWMEFYGDGVYTVDMKASEFVIDSDRQYVLVRVPRPELTNCKITQANQLRWKNGLFDKSISVGTDLAVEMRNAGYVKLNNYMKSNAQFYKSAKSSAQIVIANLVKSLNSELTDLVVEVEFVE